MKFLFCAANSWPSPSHVGSHNLATALANMGHRIAFVSDPISLLHLLKGMSKELKDRLELWKSHGQWLQDFENKGKIWAYVAAAPLTPYNKPLLRSNLIAKNWHKFSLPPIPSRLKEAGFDNFDMVYVDSAAQAYWWKELSYKKSVFRLADNPAGYTKHTKATEKAISNAAGSVDLVLYTAPSLKNLAKQYNLSTAYFPNAVNYDLFSSEAPCPAEYKKEKRPIVLYVGAIDYWFDWDCLCHSAGALPDRAFYIIGPKANVPIKAQKLQNIIFLGTRAHKELPSYMQHASAGIIPFSPGSAPDLVHSINPLKLYEYMAAGLPVVSTRWEMLESLNSPALLADNKEEFTRHLHSVTALSAKPLPLKESQSFAARFSWEEQAKFLLQYLNLYD